MSVNDLDLPFALVLVVVFSILSVLVIALTRDRRSELKGELRLFLCAFLLRFLMSVVIYQFGLVNVLGDEDATGWVSGVRIQQIWLQQDLSLLELPFALAGAFDGEHRGYGFMLALLFFITGTSARLPAAALNCLLGALTVVIVYRIGIALFSYRVGVWAGWLSCLFPSLIVWSAQTQKEPVVIFLETVALYSCINLKRSGFSLHHAFLCTFVIVLMIPFRFYAAYIAGAAVLLSLSLPQFGKGKLRLGSAVGVLLLVLPILAASGVLVQHEARLEQFDLQRIETFRRDVSQGEGSGSGVRSSYDLETADGFLLTLTVGAAHLLLAPFPWELGRASWRMLLTIPELVIWWWLFFAAGVPGLWQALRNRFSEIQPLLFLGAGLGLLYSVMFGNIGLIYRQRAQLLPLLLIFAAVGLELRLMRRRENKRLAMEARPAAR